MGGKSVRKRIRTVGVAEIKRRFGGKVPKYFDKIWKTVLDRHINWVEKQWVGEIK